MSLYHLEKIFKPASVAVVGATEREFTVGRAVLNNLINGGFNGHIYPVNPSRSRVLDLPAYETVTAIGRPVDLVVICTDIETVKPIIEECAELGVGGAIILSAGGKEIGPQGALLEKEIKAAADKGGVRLIGPNCVGISSSASKLNASFTHSMPLPGKLAFIAQSGAVCTVVLDFANQENIGFSHFISLGSMLDVDFGDLIDYLGNDPDVGSILLYIEGVPQPRKFLSAARAVSRIKPIIVLKSGRSRAGAKAALSHTGALAGEDAVYDAAFKRAGIVRVKLLEDLFGCAELLAKQRPPKGPNLGIVTIAGGLGVMAADYLADFGLEPATLRLETLEAIDQHAPAVWSRGNPMDLTGAVTIEGFQAVLKICTQAEELDANLLIYASNGLFSAELFAAYISEDLDRHRKKKPIIAVMPGGADMEPGRRHLNRVGIPTYSSPEAAIRAFHYLYTYERNLKLLQEIPTGDTLPLAFDTGKVRAMIDQAINEERFLLTEFESKTILQAYGFPVNHTEIAPTAMDAVRCARVMGYPVAAKIHSSTITHKSDVGGIILDLRNADDVIDAFEAIETAVRQKCPEAHFGGVTIQQMIRGKGHEVILGLKQDPDFGPVLLFGMGGVLTELIKDRAIGLPPLNRLLARRMLEETKIFKLLQGYRKEPPANIELLEEILMRLSQLAVDFPEINELDINPLLLIGKDAWAVDARIVLKPSRRKAPWHMAISCYPAEYETAFLAKNDQDLFIRPIKPEDAQLLADFFLSLSERTILHRFLQPVTSFEPEILARFTQIDYDRDLALVAIDSSANAPQMVGVARYFRKPGKAEAKAFVVIADKWQGQALGAKLLEMIVQAAFSQGIKTLHGECLMENRWMINLAREFGAEVVPHADGKRIRLAFGDAEGK